MIGSKGSLSEERIDSMTQAEVYAWLVALGEANGGKWDPYPDNPLHFREPESK